MWRRLSLGWETTSLSHVYSKGVFYVETFNDDEGEDGKLCWNLSTRELMSLLIYSPRIHNRASGYCRAWGKFRSLTMCRSYKQESCRRRRSQERRKSCAQHQMARAGWPRYRHRLLPSAAYERLTLHKRGQRASRPNRILSMLIERRWLRHNRQSHSEVIDCG